MKQFDAGAKQLIAGIASMTAGVKAFGMLNTTFGASVTTAVDFEQAMARVGAVSGAIGEDFEKLSQQARDLGRDTQYSATQAANSQELLARAGFQTNEIISAMPHLLYMAGAEGMELARAADIAAGTLRGFNLEATEMSRVANVLAKTSSSTNTSIDTLGESFKYVAPDAKALKVSIEEVAALVGVMGDANIKASQAGTYLRGAFNKLVSPTKETKDALKQLGISIQDSHGELKSFDTLMQEFSARMQGMTGFQKKELFGKIFDARSSTGMLSVLTAFESGKLSRTIDELYHVGDVAKEMYDRMSATAQGAMKRLESATEGMRIAIGNHLLPAYTWVIDKMAQVKSWLTQLIETHPVISKAVIGLSTSLLTLSGTALILVGALASIGGFIKMWPMLKTAATLALTSIRTQARSALAALSGLRVPVVGMIALAGALYYAWRKNLWGIRDMVTAVTEGFRMAVSASTDGIAEVDKELADKLKAAGIWDYAVTMGKVFFRVRQFWNGLVEGISESIDFIRGVLNWMKDIFSPLIKGGQELLKFLGILKPVAKTQVDTWRSWGQLLGRLAPVIVGVIAAFKGFTILKSIFGTVGQAITGMFSLITAHPIVALVTALVAAGIYLYTHWEEISEYLAMTWDYLKRKTQGAVQWIAGKILAFANKVEGIVNSAVNWVRRKWQSVKDWWNSWTLKDVFAPVINWAVSVKDRVLQKWQEFSAWWDSWTLGDVFAGIYDFAAKVTEKIKQPFIKFKEWLLSLFAKMNPFNWELPSWLGGGKGGDNQVKNTETALSGFMPPEIPATQPEPVNIPTDLLPPSPLKPQTLYVTPEWTKGMEELNARFGLNLDVPSMSIPPAPAMNVPQTVTQAITMTPVTQSAPVVNVAPVSPAVNVSQNIPALQPPAVNITQPDISNALASIEQQLGIIAGNDFDVRPIVTSVPAPSSPLLIQHSQNQASMAGQATVQAQAQAPDKPVNVNNHVDVKVESKPANVILDGEKIGSFTLRWVERQNIRNGIGES